MSYKPNHFRNKVVVQKRIHCCAPPVVERITGLARVAVVSRLSVHLHVGRRETKTFFHRCLLGWSRVTVDHLTRMVMPLSYEIGEVRLRTAKGNPLLFFVLFGQYAAMIPSDLALT